ncbi:hypothetical protein L1887_29638 [Cichorium endivia]|nr:hypothetical protein L1887_29638 [Cichorium endivia]
MRKLQFVTKIKHNCHVFKENTFAIEASTRRRNVSPQGCHRLSLFTLNPQIASPGAAPKPFPGTAAGFSPPPPSSTRKWLNSLVRFNGCGS